MSPSDADRERARLLECHIKGYGEPLSRDDWHAFRGYVAAEFAAVREEGAREYDQEAWDAILADRDAWRARAEKAEAEAKMWKLCARSPAPPAKPDTGERGR